MTTGAWFLLAAFGTTCVALALARARHTFDRIIREEAPRMTDPAPQRTGYEKFTGAFMPVTFDSARAAEGLPAWRNDTGDQFFTDNEVTEK